MPPWGDGRSAISVGSDVVTTSTPIAATTDERSSRSVVGPVGVLVGWTLFVWAGRVRNVVSDPSLHGPDRTGPLVLAGSFVVLAVVVAALLVVDRRSAWSHRREALGLAVGALAAWTVGVWVVRVTAIALWGGHPVGFVAVHTVLGVVSVVVAAWAVRASWGGGARPRKFQVGA